MTKPHARFDLSSDEARRLALAAQGFDRSRPSVATTSHVKRLVDRLGVIQIDAVNVLTRAHYAPFFARLGAYDRGMLDDIWLGAKRGLFEYWGHEASLLPHAQHPLLRWRMERAREGVGIYKGLAAFAREKRAFVNAILDDIGERGPSAASDLEQAGARRGPWWGWSDAKRALEYLFWTGEVTTAARRGFERVYDLSARVLPRGVLEAPTPPAQAAQRALLMIAAQALGVASARDLKDYFRLDIGETRLRLNELVETGALQTVRVEGWREAGYLYPGLQIPRRIAVCALISPFDNLIFERARALRVFGLDYRIEIYVPAAQRRFGYYVLPFLLGDRFVARVDLKADRQARVLRVQAAHREPEARSVDIAPALATELGVMARWLELDRVAVAPRGDLAQALASEVRRLGP